MARTWSNAKKPPDDRSAAQRARQGRPSGLSAFTIGMILISIFFMGLTLYATYQSLRHPLTENNQSDSRPVLVKR
jgi:hypothetical protein